MFHRNDWPVLEIDDDPGDLIGAAEASDFGPGFFPERAVVGFLGDTIERFATARYLPVIFTFTTINGVHPIYRLDCPDGPVALTTLHLGAPMATMQVEPLFRNGVRQVVAVGSCGGLESFDEGKFLVPVRALRDEGTSYHYLPPTRWIDLDAGMAQRCRDSIRSAGFAVDECVTWTTDAFYRETKAVVAARRVEGCNVVDMECAALAACAQVRGVEFGQILYTADTLAEPDGHDPRDWGKSSREVALRLALGAISESLRDW